MPPTRVVSHALFFAALLRLLSASTSDEASPKAHRGAKRGVSVRARKNAALLDRERRRTGFVAQHTEWWHFSAPEASRYRLLDMPLIRTP